MNLPQAPNVQPTSGKLLRWVLILFFLSIPLFISVNSCKRRRAEVECQKRLGRLNHYVEVFKLEHIGTSPSPPIYMEDIVRKHYDDSPKCPLGFKYEITANGIPVCTSYLATHQYNRFGIDPPVTE